MRKYGQGDIMNDGFITRGYNDQMDGYMNTQLEEKDVPSLQMAYDVIALFEEVNRLRREVWHLNQLEAIRNS